VRHVREHGKFGPYSISAEIRKKQSRASACWWLLKIREVRTYSNSVKLHEKFTYLIWPLEPLIGIRYSLDSRSHALSNSIIMDSGVRICKFYGAGMYQ